MNLMFFFFFDYIFPLTYMPLAWNGSSRGIYRNTGLRFKRRSIPTRAYYSATRHVRGWRA